MTEFTEKASEDTTMSLFPDQEPDWQADWQDMPEFVQEDKMPSFQIIVSFQCYDDVKDFGALLDQRVTRKTKSVWFPEKEKLNSKDYRYKNTSI